MLTAVFWGFQATSYVRPCHEQPGKYPEGEEWTDRGRAAVVESCFYSVCRPTRRNTPLTRHRQMLHFANSSTNYLPTDFFLFLFFFHLRRSDFAAAWMNLGIVQNSLQKFEEAEQSYWNAIRFRKKYPDCYYNLGRLVRDQGVNTVFHVLLLNKEVEAVCFNKQKLYYSDFWDGPALQLGSKNLNQMKMLVFAIHKHIF